MWALSGASLSIYYVYDCEGMLAGGGGWPDSPSICILTQSNQQRAEPCCGCSFCLDVGRCPGPLVFTGVNLPPTGAKVRSFWYTISLTEHGQRSLFVQVGQLSRPFGKEVFIVFFFYVRKMKSKSWQLLLYARGRSISGRLDVGVWALVARLEKKRRASAKLACW